MKDIIPKLIGSYLNTLTLIAPSQVGRLGFNIFCTPISPPVKPHHKQYLNTASQFNFVSDGIKLQGYRWGIGDKKIVFLHGWQSHSYRWKKYIESFSKDEYSIYAFDAPAHGQSKGKYANIPIYSEAIRVFLEQIGDVDSIVTHSMGSISLLHTLYHHAHLNTGKIVLMGSPGEATDFVTFYKKFTGMKDRTFELILDHFEKTLKQTPEYFSTPKFAARLKIPGLIIHDKGDLEAPYHHALRISQSWPQSKLITTDGFGHNLRAPEVLQMVKEFVTARELQNV